MVVKWMGRITVLLALSTSLTGCLNPVIRGNNIVTMTTIPVSKSLTYIGDSVKDELIVSADERGNAIITAGKGKIEAISVNLDKDSISKFDAYLTKLIEWGNISKKEKIETKKHVGYVSSSILFSGASSINTYFVSGNNGETWLGKMDFCYYNPTDKRKTFSEPCTQEVTTYINESSVVKLKTALSEVDEYVAKATNSKSKAEELLK